MEYISSHVALRENVIVVCKNSWLLAVVVDCRVEAMTSTIDETG